LVDAHDPAPRKEANYLALDNSLVKRAFGWRPTYSIERALGKTVEWAKSYLEGGDEAALGVMRRQIKEFAGEFME
jgi:CDP-glucose 4,6-dehydratase